MAMDTILIPRRPPHFSESRSFIAFSRSVVWLTIWLGLSSISDILPKAGWSFEMNSVLRVESSSDLS